MLVAESVSTVGATVPSGGGTVAVMMTPVPAITSVQPVTMVGGEHVIASVRGTRAERKTTATRDKKKSFFVTRRTACIWRKYTTSRETK